MEFRDEFGDTIHLSFIEKDSRATSLSFAIRVHADDFRGSLKEVWFYIETINTFKESLLELVKGYSDKSILSSLSPEELEIKVTRNTSLKRDYLVICRITKEIMGNVHLNKTLQIGVIVNDLCLYEIIQEIEGYM